MTDTIPGIEQSLEIRRRSAIQCPVNGWQLVGRCESCPFYKGVKTLTDLCGEQFETVQCTAELYRRKELE